MKLLGTESYNAKLNKLDGRPHLNIYELIEVIQKVQLETKIGDSKVG